MKVAIYYFSGTGTTKSVVGMFKDEFIYRGYDVSIYSIDLIMKSEKDVDLTDYDIVGIGCPIICWGIPRIVLKFINKIKQVDGKKVFTFTTSGGDEKTKMNLYAPQQIKKKLISRGFIVNYQKLFAIRSNWMVRFKDSAVKELLIATKRMVVVSVTEIIDDKERFIKVSFLRKKLVSIAAAFAKLVTRFLAKDIHLKDECTSCGICVNNCPTGNLTIKNGKLKAKTSCLCCMRCIYICPHDAMTYKLFKFFKIADYKINGLTHFSHEPNEEGIVPKYFLDYTNESYETKD